MKTVEFRPLSPLRSCFRCGTEFRSENSARVCEACRVQARERAISPSPKLSFREKQIVRLVSEAKLNKEIAYALHLSEGTIKEYLNRIFRKVGTSNRTELAIWALTNGNAHVMDECVA